MLVDSKALNSLVVDHPPPFPDLPVGYAVDLHLAQSGRLVYVPLNGLLHSRATSGGDVQGGPAGYPAEECHPISLHYRPPNRSFFSAKGCDADTCSVISALLPYLPSWVRSYSRYSRSPSSQGRVLKPSSRRFGVGAEIGGAGNDP